VLLFHSYFTRSYFGQSVCTRRREGFKECGRRLVKKVVQSYLGGRYRWPQVGRDIGVRTVDVEYINLINKEEAQYGDSEGKGRLATSPR
jgi:hypothetical protein